MNNQDEIMTYLKTVESATKRDIYDNVYFGYYDNWEDRVGAVLSRMIANNKIERVKTGIYRVRKSQLKSENPTLF